MIFSGSPKWLGVAQAKFLKRALAPKSLRTNVVDFGDVLYAAWKKRVQIGARATSVPSVTSKHHGRGLSSIWYVITT